MKNSFNFPRRTPILSAEQQLHTSALKLLNLTIFFLTAAPLMNVYIGPAPIYMIDIFAFLTWVLARRISSNRRYPLQGFVVFILVVMIISELVAGIRLGAFFKPIYIIIRTLLAMSLFFSVTNIVQTKRDFETILKAVLLGALVTATLMIGSSLPQTQNMIASQVFSRSFFLPSSESVSNLYLNANNAMRGQSLVGISIISAAFLNTIWPLLFLMRTDQALERKWRLALMVAIFLVPVGIMLSYSRGAILGLLLVLVMVLLLNTNEVRQPVLIGVGLTILIFSRLGWGSQYFQFDWLAEKSENQFAAFYEANSMRERIFAYIQPFSHFFKNPRFFFFGEGFAWVKIGGQEVGVFNPYDHAVFASAYYGYGLLAAFTYLFLLLAGFRYTWAFAWQSRNNFSKLLGRALVASLFGFSSWFLLGHALVSEPRGAMFLFFIFGLIAAQSNISVSSASAETQDSITSNSLTFK